EDHRHFAATQVAHLAFWRVAHVEPGELDGALGDAAGAVEDAHDGIGRDGFSGSGLADDAYGLALGDREIDLLDGTHDATARDELNRQVLDVQQRERSHAQVLRCGSTMSRRPSPSRLKQNTASISARPG